MKLVWRLPHAATHVPSDSGPQIGPIHWPQIRATGMGLALVTALLGLLMVAQMQSSAREREETTGERRQVAAMTIQRLEAEQSDLKRQIAELRQAIAAEQQATAATKGNLGEINEALDVQKMVAGMVALSGPGLRVAFDDSALPQIPPKEDPSMYIVHEYQLRDIVNVLWGAGAEAISINGERLVAPSSIYCVGSTILINDTRTSPPYEILAIGDSDRLADAMNNPDNLRALRSRVKVYGLQFNVAKQKDVTVPAFTGSLDVRHVNLAAEVADRPRIESRPGQK